MRRRYLAFQFVSAWQTLNYAPRTLEIEARLWQTNAKLDDGFMTMMNKSKKARHAFGNGLDESAMKGKDKQRYEVFKDAADPKTGPVCPRSTVGGLFRDAVKKQEKWRSLASGADQTKLKELRKLLRATS